MADKSSLAALTALTAGVAKVTEHADETDTETDGQSEEGSGDDFLSMIGKAATEKAAPLPKMDELTVLKDRARLMGLTFSNNIGPEALAAKIQAKLDADKAPEETDEDPEQEDPEEDDGSEDVIAQQEEDHVAAVKAAKQAMSAPMGDTGSKVLPNNLRGKTVKATTVRQRLLLDAKKLIRCRITNMDPKKKDLQGEIITVANGIVGTVRKFVPFGERTENGWMIEQFIYNMLSKRKFLQVRVRIVNGREVVESKYVKEFAIEILPQLTPAEINQLATAQLAAGSLDEHR